MIGLTLDAKYEIEKRIGHGGFATVYRAQDVKLKRLVALKILDRVDPDASFKTRFQREIESLAKLNHSNIVTVFDCGEFDGRPYLVMELVNGPSLAAFVSKNPLKLSQVCWISRQVCHAMVHAHEQGIIHRDLTLKNIMLAEDDSKNAQVKILDFGLAKLLDSDAHSSGRAILGTPSYMAPEQITGRNVDARTDIFAFGVGFHRMVNGRFPFEAEHPTALMYLIVSETDIEFAEGVPEDIKDIILRCLEKDPRNRPRGFSELATEFEVLQRVYSESDEESSVPIAAVGAIARRTSKRNPYLNRVMIKNPSDFFGRDKEVRRVYSRLDAPHPQSISIVGDRRIGKSSILNYIYQKKNRKRFMQNYDNAIFVYLDFQGNASLDVASFIDFLFGVFRYETEEDPKRTSGDRPLDQLRNIVQRLHEKNRRIILLMDEFEAITRNQMFDERFFSFLRSLANAYRVAYVTSSHEDLQLLCHNKDIADSPFFNIFSNLPLRPFSRDEAVELITVPSKTEGVPLEPYAEKILEMAGLFPLYLQIACCSLFEHLLDNPHAEPEWTQVTKAFEDEAVPHFSFGWDRFEYPERENLCRIASGKATSRKYEFVNENLLRHGFLIETEGGLSLFSSSFRSFVLKEISSSATRKKSLLSSFWSKLRSEKGGEGL